MASSNQAKLAMKAKFATVASHYMANQPRYQNLMMASFSFYVLAATYTSLNPKEKKKAANSTTTVGGVASSSNAAAVEDKSSGSGGGGRRKKRGPRVEVRSRHSRIEQRLLACYSNTADSLMTGRCGLL